MATCNYPLPDECIKRHEEIRLMKEKQKELENKTDLILKELRDIKKTLESNMIRLSNTTTEHTVKIKRNCDEIKDIKENRIKPLENNQIKFLGALTITILTALFNIYLVLFKHKL